MAGFEPRTLGPAGPQVSPFGIGGGYGISSAALTYAFDQGINYFFWATWWPRYRHMRQALRQLGRARRDEVVVATGTYSWMLPGSVRRAAERHLRRLGLEYLDVFLLGYARREPGERAMEELLRLKEAGMIRQAGVSSHDRRLLGGLARQEMFEVIMVRYNAAHRGAETEVFAPLPAARRPGVVAFNALKHGRLLKAPRGWEGPAPTARQCYRFALSHPQVDVCLAGPGDRNQVDELVEAIAEGPLTAEEQAMLQRFGDLAHPS